MSLKTAASGEVITPILFGKDGKVLYSVDGEFTEAQVQELINVIKVSL